MLLFREVKQTDLEALGEFLETVGQSVAQHMAYLHHSMLLEMDDSVIGFGAYRLLEDTTVGIVTITIDENYRKRGFGEGMLKSLLNTADLRGIKKALVQDTLDSDKGLFFEHLGFNPITSNDNLAESILSANAFTHIAHLPAFFNTACKSKRAKTNENTDS